MHMNDDSCSWDKGAVFVWDRPINLLLCHFSLPSENRILRALQLTEEQQQNHYIERGAQSSTF